MKADSTIQTAAPALQPNIAQSGFKKVLVPIDFSESSIQALRHAADMARRENIHLTLLNVIEDPISFRTLDLPAQEHKRHLEHVEQLKQLAKRELKPDVSAEFLVSEGNATEEITRHAARVRADLIVLGRHAEHGLQRSFHSQTASHVADKAPCQVIILDESFS